MKYLNVYDPREFVKENIEYYRAAEETLIKKEEERRENREDGWFAENVAECLKVDVEAEKGLTNKLQ